MQNNQKKSYKRKRWSRQDFYVKGNAQGVRIPDDSPEALEKGLRYLKRQMKDTNTIGILKSKQEYIKPSAKRYKKKKDAIRKQQLIDRIEKKYWDNFTWIVPSERNFDGPNLPD